MFRVIVFVNGWHWLPIQTDSESRAFRLARKYTMETGHMTQVVKRGNK